MALQASIILLSVVALGVGAAVVSDEANGQELLDFLPEIPSGIIKNHTGTSPAPASKPVQEPWSLWSPAAGITCRLDPEIIIAPPAEPVRTVILYSTDSGYSDLEAISALDLNSCNERCKAESSCNSFAFGDHTCWLKSSVGTFQKHAARVTGIMHRTGAKCMILADSDSPHLGDLVALKKKTREECCDSCLANPSCHSFASHDNGDCWLKSTQGSVQPNRGVKMGFPVGRASI